MAMPPKQKRNRRKRLWEQQDGCCHYCSRPMTSSETATQSDPLSPTFDHIVPRSRGGSNAFENLVLACRMCNEAKASKSVEKFRRSFVPMSHFDVLVRMGLA